MGIESWMINVAIAFSGIVFGYGLFKGQMQAMNTRATEHEKNDKDNHIDIERRMSLQVKRVDAVTSELSMVKGKMEKAISLEQAEAKFVSKTEMLLHMKNLELTATNTNNKVDKLEGKLEDILDILSGRNK